MKLLFAICRSVLDVFFFPLLIFFFKMDIHRHRLRWTLLVPGGNSEWRVSWLSITLTAFLRRLKPSLRGRTDIRRLRCAWDWNWQASPLGHRGLAHWATQLPLRMRAISARVHVRLGRCSAVPPDPGSGSASRATCPCRWTFSGPWHREPVYQLKKLAGEGHGFCQLWWHLRLSVCVCVFTQGKSRRADGVALSYR